MSATEKAFLAGFYTEYRPGELVAIARTGGVETGRHTLRTAVGDTRLAVSAERTSLAADSDDLAFVEIALTDAAGTTVVDADRVVTVSIDGPAVLAGIGTGRARTEESFGAERGHDVRRPRPRGRPAHGRGNDHRHGERGRRRHGEPDGDRRLTAFPRHRSRALR